MASPLTVCILTSGKGTRMGPYANVINKALLPYRGKAILSHLIECFPKDTRFIIALGFFAAQVKVYVRLAHPKLHVEYVLVDRYEGPGTGPGYSLLCCRSALKGPFFYLPCDGLFGTQFSSAPSCNWVGVGQVAATESPAYCNFLVQNGKVLAIMDKEACPEPCFAFSGLLYVRDPEIFWPALARAELRANEHQISNGLQGLLENSSLFAGQVPWTDVGTFERYRAVAEASTAYDFGKTDEFLYPVEGRVIKFFKDPVVAAHRVRKAELKREVFPAVVDSCDQFYAYDFVPGKNLYQHNNPQIFRRLLTWLSRNLWTSVRVDDERMRTACRQFYRDKTRHRLAGFHKKYPDFVSPSSVNGEPVLRVEETFEAMDWSSLCAGRPAFIHGDLHFDHVIHQEETDRFVLVDWRQDFAGEVDFGDLYYDLAKLLGGMYLNYDCIRAGFFSAQRKGHDLMIDWARRTSWTIYADLLLDFVRSQGLDARRVGILVGLIYLNMAPLHHPPFDLFLYGLANRILTRYIKDKEPSSWATWFA